MARTAVALGIALLASRAHGGMTGADTCSAATVHTIVAGLPDSPSVTVITGDNTGATGPDCDYDGDNGVALWWEAFELTTCARVQIDMCGTTPSHWPSRAYLYTQCPATGTDCGDALTTEQYTRQGCANIQMIYDPLPPGTYYYPIVADPDLLQNPPGPYQLTITAERCMGACCDHASGTCTDDVILEECPNADQAFYYGQACCVADCVLPGEEYASSGVEFLSLLPLSEFGGPPRDASDDWGYASPSGREYALIGLRNSAAVVEVTDPFHPVLIDQVYGADCAWRDMRTYGSYAYVVNDCSGGMDILDLSDVDDGTVRVVQRFTDYGLAHAHNMVIDEDHAIAYLLGSNLANGGLLALDISDPEHPTMAGEWADTYVHDTYVTTYPDGPYAGRQIAFSLALEAGVVIVDVTDKTNMFEVSRLTYDTLVIAHQGWLTDDRRYFLFGDEGDEGSFGLTTTTYVVDVQDLANPQIVTTHTNGRCNVDHDLMINGGLTYMASFGAGLRIFDINDIQNIHEVAYFDTSPIRWGNGAWGVYSKLPSGIVLLSDIDRGLFVLNYDCNGNEIDDTIDIANLTSPDCNANGLPDECEFDCNANAVPDSCDIAADPNLDSNGNGVVDTCECITIPPPTAIAGGKAANRYISFVPGNAGSETALRVTLTSLDGYPADNGRTLWVGPPRQYPEEDSSDPARTFTGARLSCEPHFRDWGTISELHVFGGEIVPGSSYAVHSVDSSCAAAIDDDPDFGIPLEPWTGKWGDVVPPFADDPGAPPQPDFNDIAAIVQKFLATPGAPIKAFAQLQPNVALPDRAVDFRDIAADVQAFLGVAYSTMNGITGPCACPSSVTCGATTCTSDLACGDGYCIDGLCTDACGRCGP